MVTANTRSIYGATHVPVTAGDRSEVDNSEVEEAEALRARDKAAVVTTIGEHPFIIERLFPIYTDRFLSDASELLPEEEKDQHRDLLEAVHGYWLAQASYEDIVSTVAGIPASTCARFAKNWLELEHETFLAALDDWKAAAEEELEFLEEVEPAPDEAQAAVTQEIADLKAYLDKSFRHLSGEIDDVRSALRQGEGEAAEPERQPPAMPMSYRPEELPGTPAETTSEASGPTATKRVPAEGLPRAKIWARMWKDEDRRESARFLGARLFRTDRVPASLQRLMGSALNEVNLTSLYQTARRSSAQALQWRLEGLREWLARQGVTPVGMLFLERLDFTPVGHARGELVYSLPLTPHESITVSHREWSRTSEEYVKEVLDIYEEEKEKELSEKTELAESSRSEQEVSHKLEAAVTASGGMGVWNIEASTAYGFNKAKSSAKERSSERNREMTSKASSRSKKEHKVTFRVAREAGVEDEQVRIIENPSDRPVRWDFYRMMKRWKIDLYHVGVRMTYDLVVPEPGDYLLKKYVRLKEIQCEIDAGDPFGDRPIDEIPDDELEQYAGQYGVKWDPPEPIRKTFRDEVESFAEETVQGHRFLHIEFPEGYELIGDNVEVLWPKICTPIRGWMTDYSNKYRPDGLIDISIETWSDQYLRYDAERSYNIHQLGRDEPKRSPSHSYEWRWSFWWGKKAEGEAPPSIVLNVKATPSQELKEAWKAEIYGRIKEAAHVKWLTHLEGLEDEQDRLIAELMGRDSLKLRQMEREEMMKAVLRWLIGPRFEFYPKRLYPERLEEILPEPPSDPEGEEEEESLPATVPSLPYYDENTHSLHADADNLLWRYGLAHGFEVRFIQQALEWENMNWILYPYFWTLPDRWAFKQSLEHPDFLHRSFLRAGCARVVLPIREGFEEAWLSFMRGGEDPPDGSPYVTLANEMKQHAHANYHYTPDPNREELMEFGYVFTWEDVPGRDTPLLLDYLVNGVGSTWAEDVEIQKSDDGQTIDVVGDGPWAKILLHAAKGTATLKTSDEHGDEQTYPLRVREKRVTAPVEQARRRVYLFGNLEDTCLGGLFAWEAVPGEESPLLITYLQDGLGLAWAADAAVYKSVGGETIQVVGDGEWAKIVLDEEAGTATLTSSDDTTQEFKVREEMVTVLHEDVKREIYQFDNPQDTWYEYTPTGALHIEEGGPLLEY